ncbi:MAG: AAA family ATPase [Nitrococcus mobilis]|nr:AAA family ATPase [Nitrococcus mobilis]
MRLGALALLRYGYFTDRVLDLPYGECDFHVIYGPNEAGKSTCQSAVGDLLFGIPRHTGLDFLHAGKDLRIGAELERDGEMRRVLRRKGNKDTLLDEAGDPLAESALASFLGGVDRRFFERMFSLNHRRLEQGGQEILAAEGHVGQTLFAAGAGLSGLHQVLRRLDEEADALWAPRASKKRAYYVAEERLKVARQRLREVSVAVKSWKELSRKAQGLREARAAAREALEEDNRRKGHLERIRRALPHLTALRQYQEELAALGEIPSLPEDAAQRLREAEDARTRGQTHLAGLERQLAEVRADIADLVPNETILGLEEAIDVLAQERGLVGQAQRELPRKETELATAHRKVQQLARALGWENAEAGVVLARLPARIRRDDLSAWLEAHDNCLRDRDEARRRELELEREVARIDAELGMLGTAGDGHKLAMALREARRLGNADEQAGEWQIRRKRLARELEEGLAGLQGWRGSADALASMCAPSRAEIEAHRDTLGAISERLDKIARQQEADEDRLESLRLDREQATHDGQAIARETLVAAREKRDGYWESIRARWLEYASSEATIADNEMLADGFGVAINEADELADRRFDNAEAAAALIRIERDIERVQRTITRSDRRRQELTAEHERRQAEWLASWQAAGVTPASPTVMLEWLEQRARLLELRGELDDLDRQTDSLRAQIHAYQTRLAAELKALNASAAPAESASFAALLEHADEILQRVREEHAQRRQLSVQRQNASKRLAAAAEQARRAEQAYKRWCEEFSTALAACDLDRGLGLGAARGALQTLQELAGQADAVERLTAEVARASEQVGTFGERVERLLRELGGGTGDEDPLSAVQSLSKRLTQEREVRFKRHSETQRIERMEEDLEQAREALRQSEARIARLCETAGAQDVAGLNEAIRRDARARALRESIQEAKKAALEAGDGKPLAELQAESANAEADQLAAEVRRLDQSIAERTQELSELSAELRSGESELKRLGGGEAAAIAENQRQQALADMGEAVSGYAWKRGAAILLRWSLDRYRREKQGPLLSRAGKLFRTLTLGGFNHLEVDFDERDRLELTGLRASGERVRVGGMSDGTADQLYFALRVAAIEEYLDKAPGLPFVADDLFINFDDARAVAGLEILAMLACRTQVLFFTHHRHLVELAERAFRTRLRVVEL